MINESKLHDARPLSSLKDLIATNEDIFGERPAYLVKSSRGGEYYGISRRQFVSDVNALGTKLLDLGLKGEKIAVIGENCYQWVVAYFAIINGTGVVIPLDKELSQKEIFNLTDKAKCRNIFTTKKYAKYFDNERFDNVFVMDNYEIDDNRFYENHIYYLVDQGRELMKNGDTSFLDAKIDSDEMSALLFTSGTTGNPKGVMLSHNNLCSVITSTAKIVKLRDDDVSLSFLPIHHTFENTIGIMVMYYQGCTIAFSEGLKYIIKNIQEAKVSVMVGVPLIVESIYTKIWKQAKKSGKEKSLKRAIVLNNALKKFGIDRSRDIFSSVYKNFGGKFRLVICGAAALNPNTLRGFVDLGFQVTQGYGLTETAPLAAGVPDFENIYTRPGSCGPAIPNVEIKIDNPNKEGIGEILIKGPNVMIGYYEMPEETAKVIKDGWFYSGDLGFLDKEGWVYLTGRAKNVIVTKTGKNIYPEELESLVIESTSVKDCMVYGSRLQEEDDDEITIQILPDIEEIELSQGRILTHKELEKYFKEEIYQINKELPSYKRMTRIIIREGDFVRTTTNKIKRQNNV